MDAGEAHASSRDVVGASATSRMAQKATHVAVRCDLQIQRAKARRGNVMCLLLAGVRGSPGALDAAP